MILENDFDLFRISLLPCEMILFVRCLTHDLLAGGSLLDFLSNRQLNY